jgi:phosphonate transport system permease protein
MPNTRTRVVLAIALAAGVAALLLRLSPTDLVPVRGGLQIVRELAARALTPALDYEGEVPSGTPSLLATVASAARRTLVFATAAMTLALPTGLVLGFLGSRARVRGRDARAHTPPVVFALARVTILSLRSVHELLWAVLFLAAFGLSTVTGVVAIALPFAGTLAKVFSEVLDEAPNDSAHALAAAGASPAQAFFFGLLPRALPDIGAYAFYRYECAVRSSAVLGFFGYPTLGLHLRQSFENLHYGELWTYLYALILLVLVFEAWSGALRRRFVA